MDCSVPRKNWFKYQIQNIKTDFILLQTTFVSVYAGYSQHYSDTGPVKQAIFYLGKYKYTVSFKKDVANVTDTNFELEGIKYVVTLDRSTKKFYGFLNLLEFEKAKDGLSITELEAAGVTKLADNNYTIVEEELAPKTQAILEALISRHNRKKVDAIVNLAGYLSDEEFATLTGKDRGACNFDFNNKNLQYSDECLDELISKLNADNFVKDNTPVTVNGIVFDYIEIKKRCAQIKQKLQPIISTLTEEEKLILDLPITQWKVGFKYGAISILHWMEGSGTSIKMPYEYVVSSDRLKGIDSENLKNYFENIRYLSLSNLGYRPSNPDGVNLFLFNESIGAAKKSLDKFLRELKEGEVGNFNNIATTLDEPIDNNNFFTAFPLGSITGDLDDIGASFGRFAQRVYFKGRISKNTNAYLLNIVEVATRFADEFSFSRDSWTWWLPSTYDKGQHLGCWRINCNSTNYNDCLMRALGALSPNYICVQDDDFLKLKIKALKHISNFGNNFLIYTDNQIITDEYIKKTIEIH